MNQWLKNSVIENDVIFIKFDDIVFTFFFALYYKIGQELLYLLFLFIFEGMVLFCFPESWQYFRGKS